MGKCQLGAAASRDLRKQVLPSGHKNGKVSAWYTAAFRDVSAAVTRIILHHRARRRTEHLFVVFWKVSTEYHTNGETQGVSAGSSM